MIQGPCPKEYRERVIEDDSWDTHMHPHTYVLTPGNMHIHIQEKIVS